MKERKKKDNDAIFIISRYFLSTGAAIVLVMLFVSPIRGNKMCAEEAIELFIHPTYDSGAKELQILFVPIVLEFCKLLTKTSHETPLYISCLRRYTWD